MRGARPARRVFCNRGSSRGGPCARRPRFGGLRGCPRWCVCGSACSVAAARRSRGRHRDDGLRGGRCVRGYCDAGVWPFLAPGLRLDLGARGLVYGGFCPDGVAGSGTDAICNFDSNSAMRFDAAKSTRLNSPWPSPAKTSASSSVSCPARAAATSLFASASVPISPSIPPAYTIVPESASRNNRNLKIFFAVDWTPVRSYIHCTSVKCYLQRIVYGNTQTASRTKNGR